MPSPNKISEDDLVEIRRRYDAGETQRFLAEAYVVPERTIRYHLNGEKQVLRPSGTGHRRQAYQRRKVAETILPLAADLDGVMDQLGAIDCKLEAGDAAGAQEDLGDVIAAVASAAHKLEALCRGG